MSLLPTNELHNCRCSRCSFSTLQSVDAHISYTLYRSLGKKVPRRVFLVLEHIGGPIMFPLALFVGCFPHHYFTTTIRTFALNLFLGLLIDLAFVGLLKCIVRRPRPSYNDAGDYLLVVDVDRYSFPSGHASRCLFVGLFWMMWHLGSWWMQCLVFWWSLVTALSRVLLGRHYFSDIAAGGALAFLELVIISKARQAIAHILWDVTFPGDTQFRTMHHLALFCPTSLFKDACAVDRASASERSDYLLIHHLCHGVVCMCVSLKYDGGLFVTPTYFKHHVQCFVQSDLTESANVIRIELQFFDCPLSIGLETLEHSSPIQRAQMVGAYRTCARAQAPSSLISLYPISSSIRFIFSCCFKLLAMMMAP